MTTVMQRAESVLALTDSFVLPELILHFYSNKKPVLLAPPQRIALERVERLHEVLVLYSGGKRFLLAVNPGENLEAELRVGEESALCVSLASNSPDFEDSLINGALNKTWLYNLYAHTMLRQYMQAADALPLFKHRAQRHVSGCPRQIRVYKGKPYANVELDCKICEYCIDDQESDFLYCAGRSGVILPEDFNKPHKERYALYPEMQLSSKTEQVQKGICPRCGGRLVERKGSSGPFVSCSHYPFCRFSASYRADGSLSFNLNP